MNNTLKAILFITFVQLSCWAFSQEPSYGQLQNGDLLFQDLDCDLCEAIEDVTTSYGNKRFSHIGMIFIKGSSTYVLEAIGKGVVLTPLADFEKRTTKKMLLGRVKAEFFPLVEKAVLFGVEQVGKSYDTDFLYNNGKYYCSELIYDAFLEANNKQPFFELQPMTFKEKGSGDFSKVWVDYFRNIQMEIPEGKAGINPGGISRSDKIQMYSFE
jgi:hypothetical protein